MELTIRQRAANDRCRSECRCEVGSRLHAVLQGHDHGLWSDQGADRRGHHLDGARLDRDEDHVDDADG